MDEFEHSHFTPFISVPFLRYTKRYTQFRFLGISAKVKGSYLSSVTHFHLLNKMDCEPLESQSLHRRGHAEISLYQLRVGKHK